VLGQVGGGDRLPAHHPAAVGLGLPDQQAQQRRLARAVDAHDADPVAGADVPGEVVEEGARGRAGRRVPRDGVVDVLHVVDGLAEPPAGEALERHRVARRRLVLDQRLGRLDAEPRLAGARGRPAA
jgi:hypothetical protein